VAEAAARALPDDDAALVRRVLAGEPAAFEGLMRRHNRRLYRIARALLQDAAEAEDALQEAYLAALGALDRFRAESSLATWLSRVVVNECLGRIRRSARRQQVIPITRFASSEEVGAVGASEAERPDRQLAGAQLRALIERKLDALPEAFRVVFVLRGVEDLSVGETAECLGLAEATVRTRFFRARRLLRESLAEELDLAEGELFEFGGEHCDRVVAGVLRRLESRD
jgi:RNA polymerase sigma-70 factor, ECF subfamily